MRFSLYMPDNKYIMVLELMIFDQLETKKSQSSIKTMWEFEKKDVLAQLKNGLTYEGVLKK